MMPAWHHSEYSTPICPLTKSTIKKTIYSNAGLCQNIQFMDRITSVICFAKSFVIERRWNVELPLDCLVFVTRLKLLVPL